jgi:hypothetical protein
MKTHKPGTTSFSTQVAIDYSLNCAIIYQYLLDLRTEYIEDTPRFLGKHFISGAWWSVMTWKERQYFFPFFSETSLKRGLSQLVGAGLLSTAQFKKDEGDNTKFYCVTRLKGRS